MALSLAARRARQHFDERAPLYDRELGRREPSYRRVLQAMLWLLDMPADRPAHILELGVGTGNQTRLLLRQFPACRVTGYDVSPAMLARARRKLAPFRGRVKLVVGDFGAGLAGGPYDAVLSANAIHHVPRPRLGALFQRLFELLRPGGQVVIAEPFWPGDEALGDLYWKARRRALAAAGIEVRDHDRALARQSSHGGGHQVTVEEYLRRLRRAGFAEVDCPWRELGRGIVHGRRPRS
ncbi:MAG: class I SAM-dependent methyltransferase [Chloroflexi bacterium]|nr:class I SAM-dependent methyltransferase [Chloroflexota bacterium]